MGSESAVAIHSRCPARCFRTRSVRKISRYTERKVVFLLFLCIVRRVTVRRRALSCGAVNSSSLPAFKQNFNCQAYHILRFYMI